MIEKPTTGRSSILTNGNSLEIRIPSRKKWFVVVFIALWLVGFTVGGKLMMDDMRSNDSPTIIKDFLIFGIAGWTVAVFCALAIILWLTGGVEIIKVDTGVLELKKQIFNIGFTKKYKIETIRHLTINPTSDNDQFGFGTPNNFLNLKGGVIKFDYGMRTVKFGGGIDEAEGRLIIETLKGNTNFNETNFG